MTSIGWRTVRALLIAIAAAAGLWLVAERLRQVARRRLIAMVPMKPAQLPADLRAAMDAVSVGVRVDAVRELQRWLNSRRPGRRLAAEQALRKLEQDDILQVATAASTALCATSHGITGPAKPTVPPPAWAWRPMAAALSDSTFVRGISMLRLQAAPVDTPWDLLLPDEARHLPQDFDQIDSAAHRSPPVKAALPQTCPLTDVSARSRMRARFAYLDTAPRSVGSRSVIDRRSAAGTRATTYSLRGGCRTWTGSKGYKL